MLDFCNYGILFRLILVIHIMQSLKYAGLFIA